MRIHVISARRGDRKKRLPVKRRGGMVLLVVAVIVMLLSIAAYKFLLAMQTEHMAASISGDRLKAQQAAYSVRDLLVVMLETSRQRREELGGLENNPLYFGGSSMALSAGLSGSSSLGASLTSSVSAESTASPTALIEEKPFGTIGYALPIADSGSLNGVSGVGYATESNLVNGQQTQSSLPNAGTLNATATLGSTGPPTRYGVKNESARLHLLKVLQWESNNAGDGVAALMNLPGMEPSIAESILDWLDEDDEPRENGAESEFYSMLTRPLMPRNGLLPDMDELLFVRGVDAFRLFGVGDPTPQSANAVSGNSLNTNSFAGSGSFTGERNNGSASSSQLGNNTPLGPLQPWAEFLTVYSAERNESYTGSPRLFINTKRLEDLHRGLMNLVSPEVANFLILYRQFGPTNKKSADEAGEQEGENDDNRKSTAGQGDEETESAESITISFEQEAKFVIENPLDLIGITITLPSEDKEKDSEEKPKLIHSPFGKDESEIAPEFIGLLDRITWNADPRIIGRVNVNEAPPEVLLSLPGMTQEIVEAMLLDRKARDAELARSSGAFGATGSGRDESNMDRQHPVWLLVEGMVDLEAMRRLWPHVTCGGDVFRAEVWGHVDENSPTFRFETVLDASVKRCRPVYYRELAAPKDGIRMKATAEEIAAAGGDQPLGFGEERNMQRSMNENRESSFPGAEAY